MISEKRKASLMLSVFDVTDLTNKQPYTFKLIHKGKTIGSWDICCPTCRFDRKKSIPMILLSNFLGVGSEPREPVFECKECGCTYGSNSDTIDTYNFIEMKGKK